MKPTLLVTIDTEEEGLWSGTFQVRDNTVRNIRGVPRFQELCDEFAVRPTYLVDTPVAHDEEAVERLCGIQNGGRCEIGAHLHPWCAPPFEEEVNRRNSYLCNLPAELQREKLTRLTESIEEQFGRRPTSFRAGRYGLDIIGARILHELGYLVDSSVTPFTDHSHDDGPNFEDAPFQPYFIDGNELTRANASGFMLEVPVSVGFNRSNFRATQALLKRAKHPWLRSLHPVGVLDRLRIVQRLKFGPEQSNAAQMKRLADHYLKAGAPCVVMMFHSSSLVPGHSPYVPDARRLETFYSDLSETFEYCRGRLELTSQTLTEFTQDYTAHEPTHVVSSV